MRENVPTHEIKPKVCETDRKAYKRYNRITVTVNKYLGDCENLTSSIHFVWSHGFLRTENNREKLFVPIKYLISKPRLRYFHYMHLYKWDISETLRHPKQIQK